MNLRFGTGLQGDGDAPLRARLVTLLARDDALTTLLADDLFSQLRRLEPGAAPAEAPAADEWLLFDLQRLILYRSGRGPGAPTVEDLLRFLRDGYPLQPFDRIAHARDAERESFPFDLACLDLLPCCRESLAPGEVLVLDLVSGEILVHPLRPHPQSAPLEVFAADRSPPPPPPLTLEPLRVGRDLRPGRAPTLDGLLSDAAGVLRVESLDRDVASLPFARTQVAWNRGAKREHCFGKSWTPAAARAVARCEGLERFQVAFLPPGEPLIRARFRELGKLAVDPEHLMLGRSPECPGDEDAPLDPEAEIHWCWAWSPAGRRWRLVPAQAVWFDVGRRTGEPVFSSSTTNACALGTRREDAALFAVLEAIERDAFLTSWYLALPAQEVDQDSIALETFQALRERFRLAFPGYRPVLLDLTSDVGVPVVGGLALRERGSGPRVFSAASCHPEPEHACLGALKDLTGFVPALSEARLTEIRANLATPGAIDGPAGHFELFALDESFQRLAYLELGSRPPIPAAGLARDSPIPSQPEHRLDRLLGALAERLREVGAELLLKDITHPDLASFGLHAVRAITPGLYPLWFGGLSRRFRITDRLRRLAEQRTGRPFDPAAIRLDPHPLS